MTLGLTNGTDTMGMVNGNAEASTKALKGGLALYGTPIGTSYTGTLVQSRISVGITTDDTKSGVVCKQDTNIKMCIKY